MFYLLTAGAVFFYMTGWFAFAVWRQDNGWADVAWGGGFVLLAFFPWLWHTVGETIPTYWALTSMVVCWALRLSVYIWLRNRRREGEDFRYRQWRQDWGKQWVWRTYLKVFLLQGVFMYIIALPILLAGTHANGGWVGWQSIGQACFGLGWLWETIADAQLYRFKKSPANEGRILRTGLWRYSRHPNYFGECLVWWGIFVFSLSFENTWWGILSPLVMTWLLLRVSGVPMLESKYKNDPDYQEYTRTTNAFVPGWPR